MAGLNILALAPDRIAQDRQPAVNQRAMLAARQGRIDEMRDGDRGIKAVAVAITRIASISVAMSQGRE